LLDGEKIAKPGHLQPRRPEAEHASYRNVAKVSEIARDRLQKEEARYGRRHHIRHHRGGKLVRRD